MEHERYNTDPDQAGPAETAELEALVKLSKDLREAARHLTRSEARYLVDTYYVVQQYRIEAANQGRSGGESAEPTAFVTWVADLFRRLEGSIKSALNAYTDEQVVGRWARSIVGIGPVLSAGLLAHINMESGDRTDGITAPEACFWCTTRGAQAPSHVLQICTHTPRHATACPNPPVHGQPIRTVGQIWRFAGLDPTSKWAEGVKRPWNARLRKLCWNLGESFIKQQNREGAIYGPIYATRKQIEIARNERGDNAGAAAAILQARKIGKQTVARQYYERGQLPPAHIHARARRYAVKLFLSAYHEVAYFSLHGTLPPRPYVFTRPEYQAHTHWVLAPDPEHVVPGLREAQDAARRAHMAQREGEDADRISKDGP